MNKKSVPLFSVVIPLYNKADTIMRTLQSVISQTFSDYEVIVVDDGSDDNGASLVEIFSRKTAAIRLVKQQNSGVSAARNRGVREARGRYIAFLDADDEWMPGFLDECARILHRYPEAMVLGTNYEYVMPGKVIKGGESSCVDCIDFYSEWPYRTPVNSSSMVVGKGTFLAVGGYSEGVGFYEDAELLFKLAARHRFYVSRKSLARYNSDAAERASTKKVPYAKYPHWQWAATMIATGMAGRSLQRCMKEEWLRTLSNNIRHLRFDENSALLDAYPMLGKEVLRSFGKKMWTSWWGVLVGWLVWFVFRIKQIIYYRVIAKTGAWAGGML